MPRESVTPEVGPFEVRVGWAPHHDVQVGVAHTEDRSIFWQLLGVDDASLVALGEAVQSLAADRGPGADESHYATGRAVLDLLDVKCHGRTYTGLWSTLGRHDCNRLIRLLRKARDAAYGKDE